MKEKLSKLRKMTNDVTGTQYGNSLKHSTDSFILTDKNNIRCKSHVHDVAFKYKLNLFF